MAATGCLCCPPLARHLRLAGRQRDVRLCARVSVPHHPRTAAPGRARVSVAAAATAPTQRDEHTITKIIATGDVVLVDFCAVWCGPCLILGKVLDNITPLYKGKLQILKVDTEVHNGLAQQYAVHSLPTLILFSGGQPVARKEGYMCEVDLRLWLLKHGVRAA